MLGATHHVSHHYVRGAGRLIYRTYVVMLVCVYVYVCMYVCMCMCVYIYVCMHLHSRVCERARPQTLVVEQDFCAGKGFLW